MSQTNKLYFELTDLLPPAPDLDVILVLALYKEKLLMLKVDGYKRLKIPRFQFEPDESISKVLRREIYMQTGALVDKSELIGCLKHPHKRKFPDVPVYVANIVTVDNPVLTPSEYHRKLVSISTAYSTMQESLETKVANYLLYQAEKRWFKMKKS